MAMHCPYIAHYTDLPLDVIGAIIPVEKNDEKGSIISVWLFPGESK